MSVEIQWINHASFRLAADDCVVYIDPWKLSSSPADADVVFVSHDHFDHFSADDVTAVSGNATVVVGPVDTVRQLPNGRALEPGQRLELSGADASLSLSDAVVRGTRADMIQVCCKHDVFVGELRVAAANDANNIWAGDSLVIRFLADSYLDTERR